MPAACRTWRSSRASSGYTTWQLPKSAAVIPPSPSSASVANNVGTAEVGQPLLRTDWPYGLLDHPSSFSLDCFGDLCRGATPDHVVQRDNSRSSGNPPPTFASDPPLH